MRLKYKTNRFFFDALEHRCLLSFSPSVTDKVGPTPVVSGFGRDLNAVWDEYKSFQRQSAGRAQGFQSRNPDVQTAGDRVLIDAVAAGETGALLADLQSLVMQVTGTYGRVVSGWLPIDAIGAMDALPSLKFAHPTAAPHLNAGAVTSEGDVVMRADEARSLFGLDGTGVKVGVLSDSFDTAPDSFTTIHYAQDIASGDLPASDNELYEV